MSSLKSIKKARLKKLANIRKEGINPYPSKVRRTHTLKQALDDFDKLTALKRRLILAGRLKSIREHGGSAFAHLEDAAAQVQLYFKRDELGGGKYKFFLENFDLGDWLEAEGEMFLTKKGEKTLLVKDYRILTKALLPWPGKWPGLRNTEERFRKRYLDLLMNKEVRQRFVLRSKIIQTIREFLNNNGFIEVETPILQILPGGASARPFKTHLNALNLDLYLRIAPELYLKRLLVGGFERVYEIGRNFRNEGIDWTHNPDFTELEFYAAYWDYWQLMEFTEEMFEFVLKNYKTQKTNSKQNTKNEFQTNYQNHQIDFKRPWPRVEFSDLIKEHCGLELEKAGTNELRKKAKELGLSLEKQTPRCKIIDEIYKKSSRPKLIQPVFVINQPIEMTPLAKSIEKEPNKAARFQLVVGGIELINAFSELNDPLLQVQRFKEQEKYRKAGEKEAQRYDKDFIEALEYGLPPAAGLGLGLDRLIALLTNAHSLREIILFPLMKPK